MLIKEISEDLTVIIINNNKVPNFPLKKALWKGWNRFLGQLQTLHISQQWSYSAAPPAITAHLTGADLLLVLHIFSVFLIWMVLWPAFPFWSSSWRGYIKGKTHPCWHFSAARSTACYGHRAPSSIFELPGEQRRLWNTVTFKRPSSATPWRAFLTPHVVSNAFV